jgi:hypothetical protein
VRLLGRVIQQDIPRDAELLWIGDYARLGGRDAVSGLPPGRFHDRDLMAARLSYLFPLQRFFELDLHVESGGVFPDLTRTPRLDRLQQSVGVSVRTRSDLHPLSSAGIEVSRDAVRLVFTLTNPDR